MVEVCLSLGKPSEAIEYVERSKNRNLVEIILRRDLKAIFPEEVITELERYENEITVGQYQIQCGEAEDSKVLSQQLYRLRQKRNELQDGYLPVGFGFQLKHFQRNLDPHTAILEFYLLKDRFTAFILTRETQQPKVLQSQRKDLSKLMKWLKGYLIAYYTKKSCWKRRLATRLRLLAQILHIDEIIQQIPKDCKRLILIPHQYLHLLPLHALPINSQQITSTLETSTLETLIQQFSGGVSYAPSCQLLQLAQVRKRLNFTHLFAVQNPTSDLDYANLEVEAIRSFFQAAEVLADQEASEVAVKTNPNLLTAHCCHFSSHGYFNSELPIESALLLAETNVEDKSQSLTTEDGLLTLGEVFSFKLNECRLVTLSACETGLIDPSNISDEYIGLPSGFLVAGSPAVVSSLWTVNDLSTALLMIKFYENLHHQMSLAVALNQAQLWLRDASRAELTQWIKGKNLPLNPTLRVSLFKGLKLDDKPFYQPFHWAAFCAIGQ